MLIALHCQVRQQKQDQDVSGVLLPFVRGVGWGGRATVQSHSSFWSSSGRFRADFEGLEGLSAACPHLKASVFAMRSGVLDFFNPLTDKALCALSR